MLVNGKLPARSGVLDIINTATLERARAVRKDFKKKLSNIFYIFRGVRTGLCYTFQKHSSSIDKKFNSAKLSENLGRGGGHAKCKNITFF